MAEIPQGQDKNCVHELNRQIQGLQARVSQAENDIAAHYQGISALVAALAGTPAAAAAAAVSAFYNFEAIGFKILQSLVNMIPVIDFKQLSLIGASALIDGMTAQLEALVDSVAGALLGIVNGLFDQVLAIEQNIVALEEQLTNALEGEIAAIEAQLEAAQQQLADAQEQLQKAMDHYQTATGFLTAQKNLSKCVSNSARVTTMK